MMMGVVVRMGFVVRCMEGVGRKGACAASWAGCAGVRMWGRPEMEWQDSAMELSLLLLEREGSVAPGSSGMTVLLLVSEWGWVLFNVLSSSEKEISFPS